RKSRSVFMQMYGPPAAVGDGWRGCRLLLARAKAGGRVAALASAARGALHLLFDDLAAPGVRGAELVLVDDQDETLEPELPAFRRNAGEDSLPEFAGIGGAVERRCLAAEHGALHKARHLPDSGKGITSLVEH